MYNFMALLPTLRILQHQSTHFFDADLDNGKISYLVSEALGAARYVMKPPLAIERDY